MPYRKQYALIYLAAVKLWGIEEHKQKLDEYVESKFKIKRNKNGLLKRLSYRQANELIDDLLDLAFPDRRTERQNRKINVMKSFLNMSPEGFNRFLERQVGPHKNQSTITRAEATILINGMNKLLKENQEKTVGVS